MTKNASQFVGSIPENYDKGLGPHIFEDYADDLTRRVSDLIPSSVLELAAGTGIVSRRLRSALPRDCSLVASDLNPPMLEVAKAKFQPDEPVRFEVVDAMNIGFRPESFDVVACQFGVMFFPDKDRAYAQVHRVLKPGGAYVFNVWDSWHRNPFAKLTHETVQEFIPEDPPGFYKIPFGYHDPESIEESLRGAGFSDVTIEQVALRSAIPSAAAFARGAIYGNPIQDEIVARGVDPEAVVARLTETMAEGLGAEMPLNALVIEAAKG